MRTEHIYSCQEELRRILHAGDLILQRNQMYIRRLSNLIFGVSPGSIQSFPDMDTGA